MWNKTKTLLKRYFVDAMSAMALGLFSSLIIGLILSQLSKLPFLSFLAPIAEIVNAQSPVVGGAIGAAVAFGLKASPLTIFTSVLTGGLGYSLGGPVGAYLASVTGAECARLIAGKTKVDIVLTPLLTALTGGLVAQWVGPPIQSFMKMLGGFIEQATTLLPFPMGIAVATVVGLALTAPISSAALCIMLDLGGLAAGAATVGCCAQMVGFAVASYRDNGVGGLISQGLGTSMLQFGNIMRRPHIWIAPTLAGAILGPLSTCVFQMENTPAGAGMGTSGLVGQFGTVAAMSGTPFWQLVFLILLLHVVAPAVLVLLIDRVLRKLGWVRPGDMKLWQID